MNAFVARFEDGMWHIHCPECVLNKQDVCAGKYSDRVAALSNASAHMRSEHKGCGEQW
jgi:uncharacterized membrane protein